jgi:hypothetical protein
MNPTSIALVMQPAVLFWIVVTGAISFSWTTPTTNAFSFPNTSRRQGGCGRFPSTPGGCWPRTTRLQTIIQSEQLTTNSTRSLDAKSLDDKLSRCKTARQANNVLREELGKVNKNRTSKSLYGSISIPLGASVKGISDADLAIQTRLTNKKYKIQDLIELNGNRDADRASLAVLCLTVACTTSAISANQSLGGMGSGVPEILRFVIVWLLSFAPLAFAGYGIATPEKLQTLLVSIQRELFPAYRQRMIQHEAGHLLMGHLLGWPIAGYRANAVKNAVEFYPLRDGDKGDDLALQLGFDNKRSSAQNQQPDDPTQSAAESSPFFSEQGRGAEILAKQSVFREKPKNYRDNPFLKLASTNEPTNAWPYRGFDDATLDQLAVISVAGVCAEILALGNADGGIADLYQLRQIFASANDAEITSREANNRIRFALAYTMTQLRRHLGVLDEVASVMERGGSLAECIVTMEECKNLSGATVVMGGGEYELCRRQDFRSSKVGWIERIFLGDEKTADTDRDRLVEGKGGGYRKEKKFRLTGDDALYAAMAVSLAFLAWASAGGLSLH